MGLPITVTSHVRTQAGSDPLELDDCFVSGLYTLVGGANIYFAGSSVAQSEAYAACMADAAAKSKEHKAAQALEAGELAKAMYFGQGDTSGTVQS